MFKKIYGDANDDVKKAMMKSYQEVRGMGREGDDHLPHFSLVELSSLRIGLRLDRRKLK